MSEPIPADVSAAIAVLQQTRSMTAALAAADRVRIEGGGEVMGRVARYVQVRHDKPMRQLGDAIHAAHGFDDGAELLLSDVAALVPLITSLRAENARLRVALTEISKQKLTGEISKAGQPFHEWEEGYDSCVRIARAALAHTPEDAP